MHNKVGNNYCLENELRSPEFILVEIRFTRINSIRIKLTGNVLYSSKGFHHVILNGCEESLKWLLKYKVWQAKTKLGPIPDPHCFKITWVGILH